MDSNTLKGKKLQAYVIIKILKFCTGSSAKSYQCKFALSIGFGIKRVESMEELGLAIKAIINYYTIRGKFSSVHPDLAAEGISRVEVGEEGLHFIRNQQPGKISFDKYLKSLFADSGDQKSSIGILPQMDEDEDEMLKRAIAMSLEESPPEFEEL